MAVIIQIRRDTAANWTTANPTLALGEMGYETDTGKLKFGNGLTPWTGLSYFAGGGTSTEFGGKAWVASNAYVIGDVVVELGTAYYCSIANSDAAFTVSNWTAIGLPERGGIVYDPLIQYVIGDIVSIGDKIYIIGEDPGTPGNPMPIGGDPSNPLDNTTPDAIESMDPERGGVAWQPNFEYSDGDIVMSDAAGPGMWVQYYCQTNHTSSNSFNVDIANWTEIEFVVPEVGGKLWVAGTVYAIGDIVVNFNDSQTYRCITANTDAAFDPAHWRPIETAGKMWDSTVMYAKGDIANMDTVPLEIYISIQDGNVGNQPPSGGTDANWQELDSIFYNSPTGGTDAAGVPSGGLHTSRASVEYPDTTAEIAGAIWYITGLGRDGNGDPIYYTMTGGDLDLIDVKDGDRFTWTSGISGAETWLHSPAPTINGERGGLLYRSALVYEIGDICTYSNVTYICIQSDDGKTPDASPSYWREVISYSSIGDLSDVDLTTPAVAGDILVYDATAPAAWKAEAQIPERGGVSWKAAQSYLVGDIIMSDHEGPGMWKQYYCNTSHTSTTAAADAAKWTEIEYAVPERGGIAWKLGTSYVIGDVTTELNLIYVCIRAHTALTGDVVDGSPSQAAQNAWVGTASAPSTPGTRTNFTATAGQIDFLATYTAGRIDVFVGGVKAHPSEYTATNGTNVVFNEGIDADTWVQIATF